MALPVFDLLDTCCASDAKQAFSWANLGAKVIACDIAPTAIEIARANALGLGVERPYFPRVGPSDLPDAISILAQKSL